MAKAPPKVSGRVLAWARERASLTLEEVAEHLRRKTINAAAVLRWERGEQQPSPAQIRRLVQLYRIPERWLFLEEPPTQYDDLGVVDYRTTNLAPLTNPSLNLRGAIEHALALQAWVAEHRAQSGESACPFVSTRSTKQSPNSVARYIEEVFDVSRLRAVAKDAKDFFAAFRRNVEDKGALVLKMGQVANKTRWSLDPEEFKGFTLIDEDHLAPLIFINRRDHEDAQLFTFVHELAHVVTGGSGVSNEDIEDLGASKARVETFCDEVATEVLVPSKDFDDAWHTRDGANLDQIAAMAVVFKVTPLVFARRAARSCKISERSFHQLARRWRQTRQGKAGGGPPPDRTRPSWYGRGLAELLASAACTGHPAAADALDLLGVKLDVARKIVERSTSAQRRSSQMQEDRDTLPTMSAFVPVRVDASWKTGTRLGS